MIECSSCYYEKDLSQFASKNDKRCKDCKNSQQKAYYRNNKEQVKLRSIKRKYKLSKDDYYKLLENGCEVCGASDPLVVDHNHNCCPSNVTCGNCIRGALCKRCNIAEGLFKNDPNKVQNLLKYMKKHGIIE